MFRSVKDTVIQKKDGQPISPGEIDFLKATLPSGAISERSGKEGVTTLSVSTRQFRQAILGDRALRNYLRESDLQVQDLVSKRGKVNIGELMEGRVYVKATKSVGLNGGIGSPIPLANSLEVLRSRLEDWAQVKIPATVLLLVAGFTTYGAYRLGNVVVRIGENYANSIIRASSGDKGLEEVVGERSGTAPERNLRGQDSSKNGEVSSDSHVDSTHDRPSKNPPGNVPE